MTPYTISITFLHPFNTITPQREITMKIAENTNFEDLVEMITAQFGIKFRELLLTETKEIRDSVFVLVNGRNIASLSDNVLSQSLADNQEYVFCASIGGGQTKKKR